MIRSILSACFVMFVSATITAQSITLIQDVEPGITGSIRGESVEFKGNVYYIGTQPGQFGNQLIKYDALLGTVYSVSDDLSSSQPFSIHLAVTDGRLYLSDDNILYYFDDSNDNLVKVDELSNSKSIESLHAQDDIVVAIANVFFGDEGAAYVIKDDMSDWVKINPTDVDEELTADIGNDYISIRAVGLSADLTVGNYLIEKATLNVVDPLTVLEATTCNQAINLIAVDDYILYDCNNGDRFAFSIQDNTHTEISGETKEVVNGANHIFIGSGVFFTTELYSLNKVTNEESFIADDIRHIGLLNEAMETLYFLRNIDAIYSTVGESGDLISYDIPGTVGNNGEIRGVQTFNDITMVNYDQNTSDFWTLEIKDGQVTPLVDFSNNFESNHMPFFKIENSLIFSYNDPLYGAELFAAEFMPSSTAEIDQSTLSVYPNPAIDMITVAEYKSGDIIEISDLSGRTLFKSANTNGAIDISSFESGVYILSSKGKNQLSHTSIIKL